MKNILFVCTGNSARSIIAECIINNEYNDKYKAYSAGSKASGKINEDVKKFLEKNIPGIPELIRNSSYEKIKTSILYRGLCGIANNKIILNLPGSPGGVKDGLSSIIEILPHMFDLIDGKQGH